MKYSQMKYAICTNFDVTWTKLDISWLRAVSVVVNWNNLN